MVTDEGIRSDMVIYATFRNLAISSCECNDEKCQDLGQK